MAKQSIAAATGADPRLRRAYFECRYGQLHVHNALPQGGGGFDEATTLVCLHHRGGSGRAFQGLLSILGRDRSVYAPDLPGFGESDAPPSRPEIADLAAAIGDFFDAMRFRKLDLFGFELGAQIALELARSRPESINAMVLAGPLDAAARRGASWSGRVLELPECSREALLGAVEPIAARVRAFLSG